MDQSLWKTILVGNDNDNFLSIRFVCPVDTTQCLPVELQIAGKLKIFRSCFVFFKVSPESPKLNVNLTEKVTNKLTMNLPQSKTKKTQINQNECQNVMRISK